MLRTPIINNQQIEQFKEDGFLLVRNGFNQEDTENSVLLITRQ